MADRAPELRLGGVLLHTSPERHRRLRDFYVETLGLVPRRDRDGFVNFSFGETKLTITTHDAVANSAAVDPHRTMINFVTDDAAGMTRRCADAGALVIREASSEHFGGLVATVLDPDGNMIQFLELPPESA